MIKAVMRQSITFAAVCFGLQIFFAIATYILFSKVYPGDSFTILWVYIINLIIALFVFPVFSRVIWRQQPSESVNPAVLYFFLMMGVINLLPLLEWHILYTLKVINSMFKRTELQTAMLIEFFNPVVSFLLTYLMFAKRLNSGRKPKNDH